MYVRALATNRGCCCCCCSDFEGDVNGEPVTSPPPGEDPPKPKGKESAAILTRVVLLTHSCKYKLKPTKLNYRKAAANLRPPT